MNVFRAFFLVTAMLGLFLQSPGVVCLHIEEGKPTHFHILHHPEHPENHEQQPSSQGVEAGVGSPCAHHCASECRVISIGMQTTKSVQITDCGPVVYCAEVFEPDCRADFRDSLFLDDFLLVEKPNVLRI